MNKYSEALLIERELSAENIREEDHLYLHYLFILCIYFMAEIWTGDDNFRLYRQHCSGWFEKCQK